MALNPVVASLTALVALLLVGAAVGAGVAAVHFNAQAEREQGQRLKAEAAEQDAKNHAAESKRRRRSVENRPRESRKALRTSQ